MRPLYAVFTKAIDDNFSAFVYDASVAVFSYGLDAIFFGSPFAASWRDVVLFGNLTDLPYFEFVNVLGRFFDLPVWVLTFLVIDR